MQTALDFERIFAHLPGLIAVLAPDARFTILAASDAYLAGTRRTRESLVGRGIFEAFQAAGAPQLATMETLRTSLASVLSTRGPDRMPIQRYDLPLPTGGTDEHYWSVENTPVLSESGEIAWILHRTEDVTEHAKAARAHQDAKALRATEILESIPEGFFALDHDWRFTYVNRGAELILGQSRGELEGTVLWESFPGLNGSIFEPVYRQAMEQRVPQQITNFYPDHQRWYEVHVYPVSLGVAIYFRNINDRMESESERERMSVEAARQKLVYETALSNTPDLVFVFDLEHRFMYANQALLRMWGKNREESLGRTCLELGYPPWQAEMHDREIDQVVATRQPIRGEVPFTGTDGRRVYDYIFAPVFGPLGDVVAVAGTARDTTERQQIEQAMRLQAEQLREADQAKDEFLATLSHELRNPLAPLRNSVAIMRMTGGDDDKLSPVREMMERQVNHLVRLVDDLLEVSRISRGTFTLRRERVDLKTIVRNAVESSQPLMQAARHVLTVSLPEESLWVDGDPVRLAQILTNLLDNAAKYTDDGGRIALELRRGEGPEALVTIADNGSGIAPEALPRMFNMFSRGDRTSGRGQGGLGIGLALARRLSEMHEGKLEARSEGVGKGSEFTLRLPLIQTEAAAASSVQANPSAVQRRRILVVDDNRDAGDSLAMILDAMGSEVRIARDGPEAIAAFRAYEPSLVFLDIGMPRMDGYEVARTLRSLFPKHDATIVALTGWGQDKDRALARDAGFDFHLVKPAEIDALKALLESLDRKTKEPLSAPTAAGIR
ncbi:Sensor histidine kinase RcsC [Usitatibacter rugosus]|uniref:histidine kinase n=1 Tax=Usitatibacter rugosus TaxID=2732067 RepID=A0A6M4H0A8_9PROT|nr:PAS domain-containing protein [Usitatibacter rugosus]QJR12929.1 Sensor histidine kinase RcsC [Usitatibacter rugosus]